MQGWGEGVVEQLASDLKRAFPSTTGFSAIKLWRMRQLHETYTAPDYLSQLVRETTPRSVCTTCKRRHASTGAVRGSATCSMDRARLRTTRPIATRPQIPATTQPAPGTRSDQQKWRTRSQLPARARCHCPLARGGRPGRAELRRAAELLASTDPKGGIDATA